MSIELRDIANGTATGKQSREFILEVLKLYPQTTDNLYRALTSRVFLIISGRGERKELLEWYDIVKATSCVLKEDCTEISLKLEALSDMVFRALCQIQADENAGIQQNQS